MGKKSNSLILSIFIIILFLRLQLFAGTQDMVKGMWIYGSTLTSQGTPSIINKLKDNNVKQVYLLIKGTAGNFTSASALTTFITAAHNDNIEVHLWYIVGDDNVYLSSHTGAHVYHSPTSTSYNPYPMTDTKVNLLYPGYKDYVLNNIQYFLNNFDCDGIHLDVIRYAHLVYSFDQNHLDAALSAGCNTTRILQLFRDNYTLYGSGNGFVNLYSGGDPDVVKWVNMRKNVIYDYISSIKNLIQQVKPGIELSAAFMPEGATNPVLADVHYSQNYTLNSALLDRISPMAYFKDYGQQTYWLKTVTQQAINLVNPGCKITTGYQAYGSVTADELRQEITYAMEGNSYGVIGFRYETVTTAQWAVINDLYSSIIPVELTSFTAVLKNERIVLNWQTATETNNYGFEIERSQIPEVSNQNPEWEKIAFIKGAGTTSEPGIYSFIDNKIPSGTYSYRLKQIDFDGSYHYSNEIEIKINITPKDFYLYQNYPNPFNPTTVIQFELPRAGFVTLKVYDLLGKEIKTVVNQELEAGSHAFNFSADDLPAGRQSLSSGIYFYRLETNDFASVKSMVLAK